MATTSRLRTRLSTEAQNNAGFPWSSLEAAVELLAEAVSGTTSADEYVSIVSLATTSGTIPVGALSWSITAVSGTVTVSSQALAIGSTVGGGGYGRMPLKTAVSYAITSGSALVAYDTLG